MSLEPINHSPAPPPQAPVPEGPGPGGEPPHVLVVDDEPDVRSALEDVLTLAGYRATSARNGHEALKVLRGAARAPSVILLDYMMPVMNGIEFRQAQLADGALSGIPVILISALRIPDVRELRFSSYLSKPFEIPDLLTAVARALAPEQARTGA